MTRYPRIARIVAVVTFAFVILLAGCNTEPSFANQRPLNIRWQRPADAIAAAYFHKTPQGCSQLGWVSKPFEAGIVARGEVGGCTRFIDPFILSLLSYPEFCEADVHEYGHLLGYGHTGDPNGPPAGADPLGVMGPNGAYIPACHAPGPHKRLVQSAKDRRWCAKHSTNCLFHYPNLDRRVNGR